MTATPLPLSTVYSLCGLGTLFGLSALTRAAQSDQTIVRVFLLASLDIVRLENASGNYVDVGVQEVELVHTNTDLAVLTLQVSGNKRL